MAVRSESAPGVGPWGHLVDGAKRFFDSDLWYSFRRSPVTVVAAAITALFLGSALFAPFVAPHNPFDLAQVDLLDGFMPPVWEAEGEARFLLGTDDQGRGILSTIIYGARISLTIGLLGIIISFAMGIVIGGLAGYYGGWVDNVIQRFIEILRSFPEIPLWIALSAVLPVHWSPILISFGITVILAMLDWTGLARAVRSKLLSLREEDYCTAAQLMGAKPRRERAVWSDKIVTAAGVSAGIDMALRLAAKIAGDDFARALQLGIEYDPDPPFDAGSPDKVDPAIRDLVRSALLRG